MKRTEAKVLIIGSGAAGLNAALQVHSKGIEDILILTEGLDKGTSFNTGSDKQTYYKLSICGDELDSPVKMAESYLAGGAAHGDLALIESALSVCAFSHLVGLGVPFPQDAYGQFIGYKTDHDPMQRATSIGPYTSRAMCKALQRAIKRTSVQVREGCEVIELAVEEDSSSKQIQGVFFLNEENHIEYVTARYVIFAVGGPGGLYADSVYPVVHSGAIGLGLMAGAKARNLTASQFGLASTKFRWNVSGTYLQVLPRVVRIDAEGNEKEFLLEHYPTPNDCYSQLFLKGYQWPFDVTKAESGSSRIDLLVDEERKRSGRKVYLDYRENPAGLEFTQLSEEAYQYLEKSEVLFGTPIERLMKMNPQAVQLYRTHGIDLAAEPLEIAVCTQHNNGGLAGDIWWESENVKHFFPVGEVNGSHGIKRPGGSALNAGQVGGYRIAEKIAYYERQKNGKKEFVPVDARYAALLDWEKRCQNGDLEVEDVLQQVQTTMSEAGGFKREKVAVDQAFEKLHMLWLQVNNQGMRFVHGDRKALYRTRHLLFAAVCYLSAIQFAIESVVGSRGSSLVLESGLSSPQIIPENPDFRTYVLESVFQGDHFEHRWVSCRGLPQADHWFERDWVKFRDGEIYTE